MSGVNLAICFRESFAKCETTPLTRTQSVAVIMQPLEMSVKQASVALDVPLGVQAKNFLCKVWKEFCQRYLLLWSLLSSGGFRMAFDFILKLFWSLCINFAAFRSGSKSPSASLENSLFINQKIVFLWMYMCICVYWWCKPFRTLCCFSEKECWRVQGCRWWPS